MFALRLEHVALERGTTDPPTRTPEHSVRFGVAAAQAVSECEPAGTILEGEAHILRPAHRRIELLESGDGIRRRSRVQSAEAAVDPASRLRRRIGWIGGGEIAVGGGPIIALRFGIGDLGVVGSRRGSAAAG